MRISRLTATADQRRGLDIVAAASGEFLRSSEFPARIRGLERRRDTTLLRSRPMHPTSSRSEDHNNRIDAILPVAGTVAALLVLLIILVI